LAGRLKAAAEAEDLRVQEATATPSMPSRRHSAPCASGKAAAVPLEKLGSEGGKPCAGEAADILVDSKKRASTLEGNSKPGSSLTEALQVAAKIASAPAPSVAAATPPKVKTGHDWSEEQWIQKAMQLAEQFISGTPVDTTYGEKGEKAPRGDKASFQRPRPKPPPLPDPRVPVTSTVVLLPVAGPPGKTTSNLSNCGSAPTARRDRDGDRDRDSLDPSPSSDSSQGGGFEAGASSVSTDEPCLPDDEPGFVGVHRPGLTPGLKVPLNLVEAIEEYGFDVLPDWYRPLDQVFELTDMTPFTTEAEPAVPVPGLTGAPGFSYVVPKSPRTVEYNTTQPAYAAVKPSEASAKRYGSRLVATRPPGPRGAPQPVPGGRGPPKYGAPATKKVDLPPSTMDLESSSWESSQYHLPDSLETAQVYA